MPNLTNMATPQFVELLCAHVDDLRDYQSLIPIMTAMEFDIKLIQIMIKCKIQTLNNAAARKVTFKAMPMDALLPMDTIQHILSFNHFENAKSVCKSFEKCFKRNQDNMLRFRKRIVEKNAHYFAPNIPFDESINQIHVIRPAGEPLVERVKDLGVNVVAHDDFVQCFNHSRCSSGARIFVQNGHYEMRQIDCVMEIENEDLQIIGIGKNVTISIDDTFKIRGNSKVLFENITLKCADKNYQTLSSIDLWDESIVWMDRCNFEGAGKRNFISLDNNACAHFKSCQFASGNLHAIKNNCTGKIPRMTIVDCTFGRNVAYPMFTTEPVICIGNVIKGKWSLFEVGGYGKKERRVTRKSVIQGNVNMRDSIALVYRGCYPIVPITS